MTLSHQGQMCKMAQRVSDLQAEGPAGHLRGPLRQPSSWVTQLRCREAWGHCSCLSDSRCLAKLFLLSNLCCWHLENNRNMIPDGGVQSLESLFFGTGTKTPKVYFKLKRDLHLPSAKAAACMGTHGSKVRRKGDRLERSPQFQILPPSC